MLGPILFNQLREMGLNLKKCVGFGTDNRSILTSEVRGAGAVSIKSSPNTIDVPVLQPFTYYVE